MKLQLNKKKLKNLSKDNQALPMDVTPKIAGGGMSVGEDCIPPIQLTFDDSACGWHSCHCG